MSEVRVRWTQNVAGRDEGYEETVERTEFIDGCLANNRLIILDEIAVPVPEAPAVIRPDVLRPRRKGFPEDVVEPTSEPVE